jgi:hypothetical protein
MTNRLEVKILTQSPDEGNLTPRRQGRCSGEPGLLVGGEGRGPVKGRLVEAVGVQPNRAQTKRRKASQVGEPAPGGEARYSLGTCGVVATWRLQSLLALPEAFCRVPLGKER